MTQWTPVEWAEIVAWIARPTHQTQVDENAWGRRMARRPTSMWSGALGETAVLRALVALGLDVATPAPVACGGHMLKPDLAFVADGRLVYVEVKTQTYLTSGTAGEKILGTHVKYAPLLDAGARLVVVCLAGAEREADKYELFSTEARPAKSPARAAMMRAVADLGVAYVRGTDLVGRGDVAALAAAIECGACEEQDGEMALVKWAGGKAKIAAEITRHLPRAADGGLHGAHYFEPFLGGGGMLFYLLGAGHLRGRRVVASDVNAKLINFYVAVRDEPAALVAAIRAVAYAGGAAAYAALRDDFNRDDGTPVERAARFYVINRVCFNGLYRENRAGVFNVPIGRPAGAKPFVLSGAAADAIATSSALLRGVGLLCRDYAAAFADAAAAPGGATVYADPPYEGVFADYSASRYNVAELFAAADASAARGVAVAISNATAARPALAAGRPPPIEIAVRYVVAGGRAATTEDLYVIRPAEALAAPITDDEFELMFGELEL